MSVWTNTILDVAFSVLSADQLTLYKVNLDYVSEHPDKTIPVRIWNEHFDRLQDYEDAVQVCRRAVIEKLADMGLHSLSALDFPEIQSSSCGKRIPKKRKRATTAEGRKAKTA